MKLGLLELDLENFKGYRKFTFTPAGHSMDIFGRNHVGKSTIADAYFWLLFGKDSVGKTDFKLLPEDDKGNVIEGLVASVTGKFRREDGSEFTLQRTYKQNFSHKKGEAERRLTSNSTNFFIDGVPKLKKDYTAFVSKLCDDQTFTLLTDPDMFPHKIGWKDRREFLIKSFAPDLDDREIINAHKELKPLGGYIGFHNVDEYAAKTKYERQKIQKEKDEIPGRIDEAEKAKPADLPKDEDTHNAVTLQKNKIKLEQQISAVRNGQAEADLRRQISEIQAQIADARAEYTRRSTTGNNGIEAEAASLRAQINDYASGCDYAEKAVIPRLEAQISRLNKDIEQFRQQWKDTDIQEFPASENICPTCGQKYPPEKQKQIQGDFNDRKARTLEKLESDASDKKKELEKSNKDLTSEKSNLKKRHASLTDLQGRLDKLTAQIVHPAPFEKTDEYAALNKKLESVQMQLKSISGSTEQRAAMLQEQLSGVTGELDSIQRRTLNKQIVEQQDQRIENLKNKEASLSFQLATYDKGLALAEKFTMQKAQDIEEKVNGAFRKVRWKLFETQVNGGINPCCEATVHGQQYNNGLSPSEKMNAGLDIINTLSRVLGVSVPLWIDNAESTTDYEPVDTQVFRLYVSAQDQKLRMEERS